MAILRIPGMSASASATIGSVVNHWNERQVHSARRSLTNGARLTKRRAAIWTIQRDLFDSWHVLSDGQRASWSDYATARSRGYGGFRLWRSGIFEYTSCNLYLVDSGRSVRVVPPVHTRLPNLRYLAVWRIGSPGAIFWQYDAHGVYEPGDFLSVWLSAPMTDPNNPPRYLNIHHRVYRDFVPGAIQGVALDTEGYYQISFRPINRYGVTTKNLKAKVVL